MGITVTKTVWAPTLLAAGGIGKTVVEHISVQKAAEEDREQGALLRS